MSRLRKNTMQLTLASVGQKALAFFYFLLVARLIGREAMGGYFLALSITTMFSVLTDIGLQPVLIREIAKEREDWPILLRQTVALKLLATALSVVLVVMFVQAMGYSAPVRFLTFLALLVMSVDAVTLTMYGVLRGVQNLSFESLGLLIGQGLTLAVGSAALALHLSVGWLIFALLVGSTFNAIFSTWQVVRRFGWGVLRPLWSAPQVRFLLRIAAPFALAGIFVKVLSSLDTLFLSRLYGAETVGVYAVAYKLTYAFQFLPMAFAAALYPAMSVRLLEGRAAIGETFDGAMRYMMLLAVPIVFGMAAIAPVLVPATVGMEYLGAVLPLQVLVFVLIPIFLDYPVGSLLNAANRQGLKTALLGMTMGINIVANIILIPRFGLLGAAWAAVISFVFLFCSGLAYIPKLVEISWMRLFLHLVRILLVGLVMLFVVRSVLPSVGLVLAVLLGGIIYLGGLWLTGAVRKKEIEKIFERVV